MNNSLTAENVEKTYRDCLAVNPEDSIIIDGIVTKAALSPAAITARHDQIRDMLAGLPDDFRASGGGGMSFLNACVDRDGMQWTGLHKVMEELFMLGMAAGLVSELLPRDLWPVLPGGVPYYQVDI